MVGFWGWRKRQAGSESQVIPGAMFTCKIIKDGAGLNAYLTKHLRSNDYYETGTEVGGRWMGQGAKELGLEGKAIGEKDPAFEALRLNKDPRTGDPLTPRTAANRRAFYDFQISAPKDISILAVTFGDDRLRKAHDAAAAAGFAELESLAARQGLDAGLGGAREPIITGNLVAAAFTHDASRELEAQIHTHLVCANATFDRKTGTWHALENGEIFASINLAGRVYQAELARRVRALGYEIIEDRVNGRVQGFNVVGVTEEDRRRQSTRRLQIEAEIAKFVAEKGRPPTAGERHVMATDTRANKLSEITTEEVRQKQLAKYSDADRRRLAALVAAAQGRGALAPRPANHRAMIEWAADHVFERKAVATEKDLIVAAIEENLGSADVAGLRGALRSSRRIAQIAPAPEGKAAEQASVASVENLLREREAIGLVDRAAKQFNPLGRSDRLPAYLKDDQRRALEELLASGDGVAALRGPAGAGKTTTLRAFDEALRAAGRTPVYAAPQHGGRRVLETEGFGKPRTVAQLLLDVGNGKTSLKGTVVVVDEAGLLSGKSGHELIKTALAAGGRVVLVGDEKQMSSVEAGDFLAMLKQHSRIRVAELKEIRRQIDPQYREAMRLMSVGRVRAGLGKLDASGLVHDDRGEYLRAAAKAFLGKGDKGESVLLVAPTWAEIDQLTATVREGLRARGQLGGKDEKFFVVRNVDTTAAQRRLGRNYGPGRLVTSAAGLAGVQKGIWYEVTTVGKDNTITLGSGKKIDLRKHARRLQLAERKEIAVTIGDRLLLQGTDKKLGISNGMFVTVRKVSQANMTVEVEGEKKPRMVELPVTYRTFTHGYAVTAHRSQGVTVDHAIVAAAQLDGKAMYVASSRGRRTLELHVPDKDKMMRETPEEIKNRASAVDLAGASRRLNARERLMRRVAIAGREFYRDRVRPALERMRERVQRGPSPRSHGRV
jgi:conjugative relaxase-like TrwC/TraI family protein